MQLCMRKSVKDFARQKCREASANAGRGLSSPFTSPAFGSIRNAVLATMPFSWTLPTELTRAILFIPSQGPDRPDYSSICASMRVCKEWKVRVHPSLISTSNLIAAIIQALGQAALMDRTFVRIGGQLVTLERRLYLSRYVDCDRVPAGNLVRVLSVSGPTPADEGILNDVEIRETLVALINLMPCLQKYDVPEHLAHYYELLCLSQVAPTLVSLAIMMNPSSDDLFPIINSLKSLYIFCIDLVGSSWHAGTPQPLHLPNVRHLEWICGEHSSEEMAQFVGAGVYGADLTATISIPLLDVSHAHLLQPFFARNQLIMLCINLPSDSCTLLLPEIMKPATVEFPRDIPSIREHNLLTLPETMCLHFQADDEASCAAFWEFLATLIGAPPRPKPGAKVVQIGFDDPHIMFTWTPEPNTDIMEAQFIQRLAPLARTLLEHSIVVTDRLERDVTCLDS
jgi:hypothetical protein